MTNTKLEDILNGKTAKDINLDLAIKVYKSIDKTIESKYSDFCDSELYEASTLTADLINKKTGMPKDDVYKLLIRHYESIADKANNVMFAAGLAAGKFSEAGNDYYQYKEFARVYEDTISKIKKNLKGEKK